MKLLLDVNVARFASISAYKKVDEETIEWGPVRITTDVLELGPPPYENGPRFLRENIPFIPALAMKGEERGATFFTYHVLKLEDWKVPPSGDWANRGLLGMFDSKEIPFEPISRMSAIIISAHDPGCFDRYLNSLPTLIHDPKLHSLIATMGPENSRDCLHMWFAENQSLDGFVTMDKSFIGRFNQLRKGLKFRARAVAPKDACTQLKIDPVTEEWFAARAEVHRIYDDHRPEISIGQYLYFSEDAERMFSN